MSMRSIMRSPFRSALVRRTTLAGAALCAAPVLARPARAADATQHAAKGAVAVFAGGCFWSMQKAFEHVSGVTSVVAGYTGGHLANPTYRQVSTGETGHLEAVQVTYDPARVSYAHLLDVYWHNIDPTDPAGEFCDKGNEYHSAVFVADAAQQRAAVASRDLVARHFTHPVVTRIRPAVAFYPAEAYHQDFYRTNAARYAMYRAGCGQDRVLRQLWGATGGMR